jgi:hypothetical protein
MADSLVVYEGTLGTTESTIRTVPTGKALIITEIRLTNKHASVDTTATLKAGTDTVIFPGQTIKSKEGHIQSGVNTVVLAGKTLKGSAGAATSIDYYISGMEVDN